jgi:hypothetical protein
MHAALVAPKSKSFQTFVKKAKGSPIPSRAASAVQPHATSVAVMAANSAAAAAHSCQLCTGALSILRCGEATGPGGACGG